MDFAVIPAVFATAEEALRICAGLCHDSGGVPPAEVVDLIDELDGIDAIAEDGGFLSMWPVDACTGGAILCTRWPQWVHTIHTLLEMTSHRSLGLVDLQQRHVFDPRGRTDVEVKLANGTRLPYLSEQIVTDLMARQTYYGDHIVAEREEQTFVQARYQPGKPCVLEYRAGSPERHFRTLTSDRSLVPKLIAAWLTDGPQGPLFDAQRWDRVQF